MSDLLDLDECVKDVLEAWNITKPPIDVFKIINNFEIDLQYKKLKDGIFGDCIRFPDIPYSNPTIILSPEQSWRRKRFTAAHELKHALYDGEHDKDKSERKIIKTLERDANSFAAKLLMPESMLTLIKQEYGYIGIRMTSQIFGVSREAAFYRLGLSKIYNYDDEIDKMIMTEQDEKLHKNFIFTLIPSVFSNWTTLNMSSYRSYLKRPLCFHCKQPQFEDKPDYCWCCGFSPFSYPNTYLGSSK